MLVVVAVGTFVADVVDPIAKDVCDVVDDGVVVRFHPLGFAVPPVFGKSVEGMVGVLVVGVVEVV